MSPTHLVWIGLAIRACRLLSLAAARTRDAALSGKDSGEPVQAPRGLRLRPPEPATKGKAGQPPWRRFWFAKPKPPAPPPPPRGPGERIRRWWSALTAAAARRRAGKLKPSAGRNGRRGTLGAFAVLLVWLPAAAVAVSDPELFDRLLLVAALGGGLLWLMQGGGREEGGA